MSWHAALEVSSLNISSTRSVIRVDVIVHFKTLIQSAGCCILVGSQVLKDTRRALHSNLAFLAVVAIEILFGFCRNSYWLRSQTKRLVGGLVASEVEHGRGQMSLNKTLFNAFGPQIEDV